MMAAGSGGMYPMGQGMISHTGNASYGMAYQPSNTPGQTVIGFSPMAGPGGMGQFSMGAGYQGMAHPMQGGMVGYPMQGSMAAQQAQHGGGQAVAMMPGYGSAHGAMPQQAYVQGMGGYQMGMGMDPNMAGMEGGWSMQYPQQGYMPQMYPGALGMQMYAVPMQGQPGLGGNGPMSANGRGSSGGYHLSGELLGCCLHGLGRHV